ncbi:MAG: preprotein translocase subunit SecG, partial [Pirellulales bacterium]|nr:preprotein translocase subunit SecG [Pirellulales bacterium]
MAFLSVFLIMLILIQRGKGGGLTGALGGPGGQSAFGSKAGDTFTVITVVVASVWAFTCAFTMWLLGTHSAPPITKKPNLEAGPQDGDGTTNQEFDLDPSGSGFGIGSGNLGLPSGNEVPSFDLSPPKQDEGTDTEATPSTDQAETPSTDQAETPAD